MQKNDDFMISLVKKIKCKNINDTSRDKFV